MARQSHQRPCVQWNNKGRGEMVGVLTILVKNDLLRPVIPGRDLGCIITSVEIIAIDNAIPM